MRIAVIVTTYDRPDALAAVLEGCLAQSDREFELIVADDGSTEETARVVASYCTRAPFNITHVWQENLGFRAAAVRNRALAVTDARYVVFTDGDCVPTSAFVARHRLLAEPGCFVAGNRVLLSEGFTRKVLCERLAIHTWNRKMWLAARLRGEINRLLPLIELPDWRFRKRAPQRWEGVKTCNLAAWRTDLLRVNGFDESYSGWGLEDTDLVVRLLRAGVCHKSGRFAVPIFHLWHRENDRSHLMENQQRLAALATSSRLWAEHGLNQYL